MRSISFNLSGKLDPFLVELLRVVSKEASSLGILFFIVGATARDIVLEHCHAIRPVRGTRDLDIGVEVAGWDEFRRLSTALVATGKFKATQEPHIFRSGGFRVDILPFGGVSADQRTISWPPDHEVYMNIMGFQEACEYAMTIRLSDDPVLDVKVPTIPGMALMKVISWHDGYPNRSRDAADLLFLMEHYAEAGNEDRLYGEEGDLLQAEGFDMTMTGIRLLGRDMAALAAEATREEVRSILNEETVEEERYRLVRDMIKEHRLFEKFDDILSKLLKLKQGLAEYPEGQNSGRIFHG